jgi:hypothetical protein
MLAGLRSAPGVPARIITSASSTPYGWTILDGLVTIPVPGGGTAPRNPPWKYRA